MLSAGYSGTPLAQKLGFKPGMRVCLLNPPAGMLWLSWPKRAAKRAGDIDEGRVRALGLAAGLVDIKVCAVDAIWSALKFVVPAKQRG